MQRSIARLREPRWSDNCRDEEFCFGRFSSVRSCWSDPRRLRKGHAASSSCIPTITSTLYPYLPVKLFAKNFSPVLRILLELYTDFLDLGRFSGQEYERRTASYLADKYRGRKPEVVIALGPQALRFVSRNLSDLNFGAPLVFCCTSRSRLAALDFGRTDYRHNQ